METAAAEESIKVAVGNILLNDFLKLLEKAYAKNASAFSQLLTGSTATTN